MKGKNYETTVKLLVFSDINCSFFSPFFLFPTRCVCPFHVKFLFLFLYHFVRKDLVVRVIRDILMDRIKKKPKICMFYMNEMRSRNLTNYT